MSPEPALAASSLISFAPLISSLITIVPSSSDSLSSLTRARSSAPSPAILVKIVADLGISPARSVASSAKSLIPLENTAPIASLVFLAEFLKPSSIVSPISFNLAISSPAFASALSMSDAPTPAVAPDT